MNRKYLAGTMVGLGLGLAAALPGIAPAGGVDVALAQRQPMASPTPQSIASPTAAMPQSEMRGVQALGNVVDTLVANTPALNNLIGRGGEPQVLSRAEVNQTRVVNLGNVLGRGEMNSMNQLISNSRQLSRAINTAQRVVRNDAQLRGLLQRQNINPNQVVALDVIGEPILYVLPMAVGSGQTGTQTQPTGQDQQSPTRTPTTTGTPARPRG